MNVVKVVFKPKIKNIDDFKVSLLLADFFNALCSNGQIHEGYAVIKADDSFSAVITVIGEDSLNEKHYSEYVRKYKKEIELLYEIEFEIIGENVYSDENYCSCENKTGYILFSTFNNSGSPIRCIDCWRDVPLYRLPLIQGQKDYHGEILWAHYFMKSVDTLETYGWAAKWAKKQLTNPNSEVSKEGRGICADFEKVTGKPFYYLLIAENGKSRLRGKCPICGEQWREFNSAGSVILCLCDKCRLALDN